MVESNVVVIKVRRPVPRRIRVQWLWLRADKTEVRPGETVTFTWGGRLAEHYPGPREVGYRVDVLVDGRRVTSEYARIRRCTTEFRGRSFTLRFEREGTYFVKVRGPDYVEVPPAPTAAGPEWRVG